VMEKMVAPMARRIVSFLLVHLRLEEVAEGDLEDQMEEREVGDEQRSDVKLSDETVY